MTKNTTSTNLGCVTNLADEVPFEYKQNSQYC